MGGLPDILFVIDTTRSRSRSQEANKLGIPVVAMLDSNSDPDGITFPIPGNDDATRAIALYCDLFAGAVLDGLQQEAIARGIDIGEAEELPAEALPTPAAGEEATQAANAKAPHGLTRRRAGAATRSAPSAHMASGARLEA